MKATQSSRLIQLALIPALFVLGAKLSLAFAVMPEVLIMLWIPNSLVLAALLHYGLRRFPLFAALIVVAQIAGDYPKFPPVEAAAFGVTDVFEATVAYLLLRFWKYDTRLAAPIDLAKFVLAAPVVAAFVACAVAAAIHGYFHAEETSYFEVLRVWWFSDGLGLLILTPLVLSLWPLGERVPHERPRLHGYDVLALLGAVAVVVAFLLSERGSFYSVPIRSVLLLPLVLYVAARFGLAETAATLLLVALAMLHVAASGRQPFGPLPLDETVLSTQEFILIMSVTALGLNALLAQLHATTRELERRVRDRTAELSAANAQLQKLAVTDSLTGVPNRRALFRLLEREMGRERRHGRELAVIMFDIDRFKAVNDHHGHAAGDAVLRHVAHVAAQAIRSIDTVGRYGGEEFVVVAPETDRAAALQLAERMREALRSSTVTVDHDQVRVTASFGVAMLRADDKEPEQLLRRADEALYAAKAAGRDCVVAEPPPTPK